MSESKNKRLYTFTLSKEQEVEKQEESTNDKGEKVTITKKVNEKVPYVFYLRKPTRTLYENAELFYGAELAKAVKAGMMTRSQLDRRFVDDGGILSEGDKTAYSKLLTDLRDKQTEYQKLSIKNDKTSEENTRYNELITELLKIQDGLQNFQISHDALFNSTAEVFARNKVVAWWVLQLSYFEENGKDTPFFVGNEILEKLTNYDSVLEGEDAFKILLTNRYTYFTTLWYLGKCNDENDFKYFEEQLDKTNA